MKKTNQLPELSNAEWEVMKVLWEKGPFAARDVYQALPDGHGWAYNTVKTMLSRLVAKGAVGYKQIGNSYLYEAACQKDKVVRKELSGFVNRVLDGSFTSLVAHFLDTKEVSEEEIEKVKKILNRDKTKRGK